MRRLLVAMLSSTVFLWPSTLPQQAYNHPEVTSAGDAYTLYNIVSDGLFVIDIEISDDGSIRRIESLRNPGSMLGVVKTSVHNWKFQPASEHNKPRASRLTVAFVYRPANCPTFGAVPPKDFTPVIPLAQSEDAGEGYVPVGILSFAYPDYPVNSVVWGSVLLQATVDSAGDVKEVNLLHGMANFDSFAQGALKHWRFRAATLHGRPVTSKIVVAFIFQPPPSSN
jgi:Gram-negative bacterial TonB protein C-terminal